ncbi:MAG: type I glyceraldehyde-3-phosphate dehydrogenase [archaeon]
MFRKKIAINGLGRIGRLVLKIGLEKGLNIVAINDLTDTKTLAYLIKHDSVYGNYDRDVEYGEGFLKVNGKKIKVYAEKDPIDLPWYDLGVDVVLECTGFFTDRIGASKHLKSGAKKVLVSAPCKGSEADITIVLGVNDDKLKKEHQIISMASCTTNCLAPVVKILNDSFGVRKGFMNTIHAYTSTQGIVDRPDKKLRRGRAAAVNIVPTTSGATTAVSQVIPEMEGKMNGLALRVPIVSGSIVDFTAELNTKVTREQVNAVFREAAKKKLKGVLEYSEEELVSSDIIRNEHISIFSAVDTQVIGNSVKVLAWYDNEYGYSVKFVELAKKLK